MRRTDRPIVLHLNVRVTESRKADFIAFLKRACPFYEKPGGIEVALMHSLMDPNEFVEVIHYRSRTEYDNDLVRIERDASMRRFLDEWHDLLLQPPDVLLYEDMSHEIRSGDES